MYTYFAKCNRSFINSLKTELTNLGVSKIMNLQSQRLDYVKFTCNQETIWKIMLYSRLIESLKIQIKDNIIVT